MNTEFDYNFLKEALDGLYGVRDQPDPDAGICSNLYWTLRDGGAVYEDCAALVAYYAKQWEHYSGDSEYPVEGDGFEYATQGNMFDPETKYGMLRLKLLDFIIEKLNEDLQEVLN
jgi:hypothetical protein